MAKTVGVLDPIGIKNSLKVQINPATYEQQVEIITYLAEISAKSGFIDVAYDSIYATYPSDKVEVYTYKASGTTVATVTVTYQNTAKSILLSVIKT